MKKFIETAHRHNVTPSVLAGWLLGTWRLHRPPGRLPRGLTGIARAIRSRRTAADTMFRLWGGFEVQSIKLP